MEYRTQDKMNFPNNGYLPPNAQELEAQILGLCFFEETAIETIIDIITCPEVFYKTAHQEIYKAMLEVFDKGHGITFANISEALKAKNKLDEIGGPYYLAQLLDHVTTSAHIEEHARILVEKWIKREIITFAQQQQARAYDDTNDSFDLLDQVATFGNNITDNVIRKPYTAISSTVVAVLSRTAALMKREISLTGVPTGFKELNRLTNGFQKGDLIILAARPSVGKTAFLLNLALNASRDQNTPTAIGVFSLEMSKEQLTQRMLANYSDISLERIKNGNLHDDEFNQLNEKAAELSNSKIYIDDTASFYIYGT